ncbi:hypothetical protein PHIN3_153 [Sinorhizobium phage phiN3]|uniref:Uncharacterized protein n=1 Tax=Sinorhizobium phage phiN3 TaxID=1647405 RepID=A0A0F6YP65_9CAUD|nr:hypothetical protein AVT40_gp380 [Sinorhizobium phage phiN3]AKF13416.1 hypothetical protein PHIN3_153 [Sinorhizobium phage phiN3]
MKVHIGKYPKDHTKERKVDVRIDNHDIWSLHHTLALIIHPALLKLKESKHGFPPTDIADAPQFADNQEAEYGLSDGYSFNSDRWDFILDEMIWSFEQLAKHDSGESQFETGVYDAEVDFEDTLRIVYGPNHTFERDEDAIYAHHERIERGTRLFGKYYTNLWD